MASIKDVAKKAGVSISTVSNVMNDTKYVSDELKERVLATIESMNYEVDMVARSLKNNRSMSIGVILTSISRIFIPQVLGGMQKIATKNGYNLIIYTTNDDFEKEQKYVRMLVNNKVDGIIVDSVAERTNTAYYAYLKSLLLGKKKIPVLSLERDLSKFGISSVFVNNRNGGYIATKHLIECGCINIAHVGEVASSEMSLDRTDGYRDALKEKGIAICEDLMQRGDFTPLSGYRKVRKLLIDGTQFDGIVADNDQMAIGAIKALMEYGLKIPADVKVIGYDNTFISSIVTPSLSTVNVPKHKMGAEAVCQLCRIIEELEKKSDQEIMNDVSVKELKESLLVRQSTDPNAVSNWDLEDW